MQSAETSSIIPTEGSVDHAQRWGVLMLLCVAVMLMAVANVCLLLLTGPVIGAAAMLMLRRSPASRNMAHGKR